MPHPELLPLTSRQFSDWLAFNRLECLGDERADLRMGITISHLLAPHMKRGAQLPKPSAFMPYYVKPTPTPEQINSILTQAIQGAKRGRKYR